MKILIVEDNQSVSDVMMFYLKRMDVDVKDITLAKTVEEAQKILELNSRLQRRQYDVCLLDISLGSGKLGTELLPELKKREIKVIITTAALQMNHLKDQVFAYFTKPVDLKELKHTLAEIQNAGEQ